MNRGIYAIVNRVNGHQYIGSAANIIKRRSAHFVALESGSHENQHLQRAYLKYGTKAFEFRVLEEVADKEGLIPAEQYWIDYANGLGIGLYNIARRAGSNLGLKPSAEQLKRFSEKMTGHKVTAETREKIRKSLTGRKRPEEVCQKLRVPKFGGLCRKGHPMTADNKDKSGACLVCSRERGRAYSKAHWKEQRLKHIDKVRAAARRWAQKNREKERGKNGQGIHGLLLGAPSA